MDDGKSDIHAASFHVAYFPKAAEAIRLRHTKEIHMEFPANFGSVSHTGEVERVPVKVHHKYMSLADALKLLVMGDVWCEMFIDPEEAADIEGQMKLIDGTVKMSGQAEVSQSFSRNKHSINFSLAFDLRSLIDCGNPSIFALAKKAGRIKIIPSREVDGG